MDFRPIVAPSIRELFIKQVEGAILSGQLKPGDRLPTERELADTMHISKTVVHEGLRELHRLGFLDIASRRGVTVADYAQTGSLETLMAIMDYHGGLPDEKTARSILRLRYYLEAPALRDLAASHTAADLDTLRALQRQAEEAPDTAALAQALFRYHRGVTFLSGNTITPLLFNAFMQAHGDVTSPVINMFIGGIVKIAVNYVLVGIPEINIVGAPVGTLVCYVVITVLNYFALRRCVKGNLPIFRNLIRPLIASAIMGAGTFMVYRVLRTLLPSGRLACLAALLFAVCLYLILAVALRCITYEDCMLLPKGEKIAKILRIREKN